MKKYQSNVVKVGSFLLGGNNLIRVQSMCSTDTRNIKDTVKQILKLKEEGCEIIRVAIPDMIAAKALSKIKKQIHIPLVADIHFDYLLALESIKQGVDKIRINPGNIGSDQKVKEVVSACKEKNIPIRIGINAGSLEKDLVDKYGVTPKAAVESALRHVKILEKLNFRDILISVKFSDVPRMVESYQQLSKKVPYPLHLGVTEAGTVMAGSIKSALGFGILLNQGIGATIRVSLTADPLEEIKVAYQILQFLGLRRLKPEMISCPTCGRCEIDLISLAEKVENILKNIKKPIKVAVMGCVVNGPGEAREADIGVAGGKGKGVIFMKGKVIKTVSESQILPELKVLLNKFNPPA